MAAMENNMEMARGTHGMAVCVRDCSNCVKAREAGVNFRNEPCYICRRKPDEPETLRHLSRINCEDHQLPEEKLTRFPQVVGAKMTYLQMAAF